MSDRTFFQMYVHHVPEAQRVEFLETLTDVLAISRELSAVEMVRDLATGEWAIHEEEVTCGTVDDVVWSALRAAAPDAVWCAWEDPKYEWLGAWVGYHPLVGLIGPVECDANGTMQIQAPAIRQALEEVGVAPGLIEAAMRKVAPQERWLRALDGTP